MLIPGQRVADQDRVAAICIERAIGFIADIDRRQQHAAIEPERPRQGDMAIKPEARIILHRCGG